MVRLKQGFKPSLLVTVLAKHKETAPLPETCKSSGPSRQEILAAEALTERIRDGLSHSGLILSCPCPCCLQSILSPTAREILEIGNQVWSLAGLKSMRGSSVDIGECHRTNPAVAGLDDTAPLPPHFLSLASSPP
jgi:hypothetical protein